VPFTKQHFTLVAEVLKNADLSKVDKETLYLDFSKAFRTLNFNFDHSRFFHAIFPKEISK